MPGERIQRQIDRLLDEADEAIRRRDWATVRDRARTVLDIDSDSADAREYLATAERVLPAGGAAIGPEPPPAPGPGAPAPPGPQPMQQPTSFASGRYQVKRFLGEGGKKRVFLAHDERLDRDVAFALIKTEGLDAVGRERIVREAQAMGRLGAHPHVVTIFEIGEEQGPSTGSGNLSSPAPQPYMVTELMAGGDVEGLLEKQGGPLPLATALGIAKGVCRGLAFAHAQGVVHRDLKPGNVWLTAPLSGATSPLPLGEGQGEGRGLGGAVAKIGDFGLAVSLDRSRLTRHGMMVGTVAYMPPEQALGGEVTPRADLYSLGAMLYELVTGKPPFEAGDPTAVISQHINTPPVAPSWRSQHCPPDLEALILRLLAKAPQDRPASAQEVLDALERVDPEGRSATPGGSGASPLDRLARGVFVGRARELERLRSAFDEAFAGRGGVVMLVGEPGIGKTRTVQELGTYARMRGAKVFWGRAHEASGAPAYWPWVQVGRDYLAQTDDAAVAARTRDHAPELQRLFPALRSHFPGLAEPPPADSEDAQFALFDAVSSFLRGASRETPLTVVLDDLHWADGPTLRLLTHVARQLSMARLLVVGTYRDTEVDRTHPLSRTLAELNREALFTRIPLRGLAESETAAYIRDTAGVEAKPELVRRIHAETEGNPFFLSEVVRLMTEEGAFAKPSVSDIAIPDGVKEALGRRLDRLSPEANELLAVASVVGRECTHPLLAALTDFDDDTLLGLVEEALRARVLEETGAAGEYRFTHALMQDALYSELSTARRVRMHGWVAETLERLYGLELDAHAAELARHFEEASVMNRSLAEKAVRYAELAAQRAEAVAAWEEAARWYQQALAGLEGVPGEAEHRGDLWMALSNCLRIGGRVTDGWAAFHSGLEAYRSLPDRRLFAAGVLSAFRNSAIGPLSDLVPLRPVLDEALAALGDAPSLEACELLALRAASDRYASGDVFAARAEAMAGELGLSPSERPRGLRVREEAVLMDRGEFEATAALAEHRYSEFAALDGRRGTYMAGTALLLLAQATLQPGQIRTAEAVAAECVRFSEERRHPSLRESALAWLARLALQRNDRLTLMDLLNSPGSRSRMLSLIAMDAARVEGDLERARRLLQEAEGLGPGDWVRLGHELVLALAGGDRASAQRLYEQYRGALDPARSTGHIDVIRAYILGSDALLAFGDDAALETGYRVLAEAAWYKFQPWGGDAADVVRGALALRLGDVDAAERHYTEGLQWAHDPEVRFGLVEGRCLQGLADVAEARGDHALAMQHLDAAAAKFAEYGAKLYLDQVLAKKEVLKA